MHSCVAQIKIASFYISASVIQDTICSTELYSIQLIVFCFPDVWLNVRCHSAIQRSQSNVMPAFG